MLYPVVLGIITPKIQMNRIIYHTKNCWQKVDKYACFKLRTDFSGNDYRVARLPKLYLTVIGIIEIDYNNYNMLRTDVGTDRP